MTKIIAHRGASYALPENTMTAFKQALDFGTHGLELDVHLSKDNQLIVCHDEKLDRTTNGTGYIKDHTLKEIKNLDAGSWFNGQFANEKIPTLEEVLELVKNTNVLLNVELKTGLIQYNGIEEKLLQSLNDYNFLSQTVISSFNHYSLAKIKSLNSEADTGVLYMAGLYQPWNYAATVGATALHPYFLGVNSEMINGAKEHNVTINTYTVDDPVYIRQLVILGVDGLITNRPKRALAILEGVSELQ